MKRRVQIRRDTNSGDPFKKAFDLGREEGLAEGKVIAEKVAVKAAARARADERQTHLATIDGMQVQIGSLNQELVRLRNEIEQLQFSGRRADPAQEKIRKRLQTNDTKDWIAQFGDGDEPFVEDEGQYGQSPARPRVRR